MHMRRYVCNVPFVLVQYGRAKRLEEKGLDVLPAWLTTQYSICLQLCWCQDATPKRESHGSHTTYLGNTKNIKNMQSGHDMTRYT